MQSATIIAFPAPQPRAAQERAAPIRHALGERGPVVGLAYVARQLLLTQHSIATIVRRIRMLTTLRGFPHPCVRSFNGQLLTGADAVCPTSAWNRAEVDAWVAAAAAQAASASPAATTLQSATGGSIEDRLAARLAKQGTPA